MCISEATLTVLMFGMVIIAMIGMHMVLSSDGDEE